MKRPSLLARVAAPRRLGPATVAFVVVLAAAGLAMSGGHRTVPLPLARARAIAAVRQDRLGAQALHGTSWTRIEVIPIDSSVEQVDFYRGPRLVVEAAVRADGSVEQVVDVTKRAVPYGNAFAYRLPVLLGLTAVFVLMTGVAPLRRLRNLDVAVMATLSVPLVLLQHGLVDISIIAAALPLVWLALRCAYAALGPRRPALPSRPLFEALAAHASEGERTRVLRTLAVAAALMFVMVGVSSPGPVDVIYAVMEGATRIGHGILPYGHLPGDIIHGDTYPILSYAAYVPVAVFAPVSSMWDSVDVALGVTVLAALAAAACRFRLAVTAPGSTGPRSTATERTGLRAAISLLCFPPLLVIVSTGTTDVLMGALLMLAIVLWRRPAASSAVLATAGWFKLAPFALVPLWLAPLRGARLLRAVGAIAVVSAACLGLLVALGGFDAVGAMVRAMTYQLSRGAFQSVWHATGLEGLQPLGEAVVLAFIVAGAVRLRTQPDLAADPGRVAALAVAALIGLQLAANYWAFLYLAWIAPLLSASLLAEPAASPVPSLAASPVRPAPLLGPLKLGGAS